MEPRPVIMLGCSDQRAFYRKTASRVHIYLSLVNIDFIFILGYVVSDWGATHDSASDNANAGLDMEQPGDWILIGKISGNL